MNTRHRSDANTLHSQGGVGKLQHEQLVEFRISRVRLNHDSTVHKKYTDTDLPQNGSYNGLSGLHLDSSSMAAASVSLRGAPPARERVLFWRVIERMKGFAGSRMATGCECESSEHTCASGMFICKNIRVMCFLYRVESSVVARDGKSCLEA
jgi:hypothetical protein